MNDENLTLKDDKVTLANQISTLNSTITSRNNENETQNKINSEQNLSEIEFEILGTEEFKKTIYVLSRKNNLTEKIEKIKNLKIEKLNSDIENSNIISSLYKINEVLIENEELVKKFVEENILELNSEYEELEKIMDSLKKSKINKLILEQNLSLLEKHKDELKEKIKILEHIK